MWNFFVTSNREDQRLLLDTFHSGGYRPSVTFYEGDSSLPIPHPKGTAVNYSRWVFFSVTLHEVMV